VPVVTALRERPRGQVEIELDGAHWRVVPVDTVLRSGLFVGRALDRETARALGRELRRAQALGVAVRALRYRDLSRYRLDQRLARRGARADARAEALGALERAGLLDDERVAASRAQALADRGYGDAAIRFDLEREGFSAGLVAKVLEALEPERERARRLVEQRGDGARAARWLTARGFDADAVADALGGFAEEA
jgi:SOS response regulatory protein OraA/RecX